MNSNRGSRVINVVYLVGFLDLLGVSMIIPMIPKYARDLGASPAYIGILGSLYGGIQLFSSPIIGGWSDDAGRRYVLLWCLLLSSISYLSLGFATSMLLMFPARLLAGLFKHSQELSRGYLAALSPREDHSRIFGYFNSVSSIGFIVGPVIGGHLSDLHGGFWMIAVTTSATFLLNMVLVWFMIPEAGVAPNLSDSDAVENDRDHSLNQENKLLSPQTSSSIKQRKRTTSTNPFLFLSHFKDIDWTNLWEVFLIRFLLGFSVMAFRSNLSLTLSEKYEANGKTIGYIMSYSGFIGTVSGFMVGKIASFYNNDAKLLLHTSIIQLLTMIGMGMSPSLWLFVIFQTPLSLGNQIARVCITNMTIEKCHGQDLGTLLGLGASVLALGRMMSPAIGGVAQEFNMHGPFVLGVFFTAIGIVSQLYSLYLPRDTSVPVSKKKD